ncbi:MAG: nuclear transport factor 2 family protein [Brevundimonas sp.]
MTVQLASPIAAYFRASNAGAPEDVAAVFAPDGEVRDERQTHRGRDAIAAWARDAIGRYRMQSEPLGSTGAQAAHTVTARVTGDFPGSPLTFTYRFTLAGDAVKALEIGL